MIIQNINAISGSLISMFKTGTGAKIFKPAEKSIKISLQPDFASFIITNAKEFLKKLK